MKDRYTDDREIEKLFGWAHCKMLTLIYFVRLEIQEIFIFSTAFQHFLIF